MTSTIQCKAVITNGQGDYRVEQVEVHAPGPGEVRVQIMSSGICHTDWDSVQNWNKEFIVGHEGAGIVESVGEGVNHIAVGDKVILNWAVPCGECFQCREGNLHICERHSPVCADDLEGHARLESTTFNGKGIERSFHLGTMSEYTVVKSQAVVKADSDISFNAASIVGCGVMTGWGSVVNAADVQVGSSVCVIGCGGVGLNCIQGAKQSGAAKIIAIDVNPERLEMAKEYGATHGIVAKREDIDFIDVRAEVKELTDGRGADFAFECTAIPALGSAPLALIRSAGTAVQVSGIEQRIDFDCELFEWDKKYINPLYGCCNPERDFNKILSLYNNGQMKLEELVTKTFTMGTLEQGFDDMLKGRVAKGVVVIAEHKSGCCS